MARLGEKARGKKIDQKGPKSGRDRGPWGFRAAWRDLKWLGTRWAKKKGGRLDGKGDFGNFSVKRWFKMAVFGVSLLALGKSRRRLAGQNYPFARGGGKVTRDIGNR
jgi:hypothetical protein